MAGIEHQKNAEAINKPPEDIGTDSAKMTKKSPLEYEIETLQLEEHLQNQIKEDRQYWLQNDAKLRAVHQGTLTYEDFRQIVASAHLKPLSKEDKDAWQNCPSRVLWNPINPKEDDEFDMFKSLSTSSSDKAEEFPLPCIEAPPKNTTEFLKAWKGLKTDAYKYIYLNQLSNHPLEDEQKIIPSKCPLDIIFEEEVPIQIFPDIINVLLSLTNKKSDEIEKRTNSIKCLRILASISKSKRFQLTMSFMSKQDTNKIHFLLKNINNLKLNVIEEKNATYTQEKVLNLLEEVNSKYSVSNQK